MRCDVAGRVLWGGVGLFVLGLGDFGGVGTEGGGMRRGEARSECRLGARRRAVCGRHVVGQGARAVERVVQVGDFQVVTRDMGGNGFDYEEFRDRSTSRVW